MQLHFHLGAVCFMLASL